MNSHINFELCVETVDAAIAAKEGGADRIELCSSLAEGGLTPSPGLLMRVLQQVTLPVHVMVRPRSGDFLYSVEDFAAMEQDLRYAKSMDATGVVFGILLADGRVDIPRTERLVALASPMEVTFHRAFDCTRNLAEALEDVIVTGAGRVLTSGGCARASEGAEAIAGLVRQAAGRIQIAAGSGIRATNVTQLLQQTGVTHIHASLRERVPSQMKYFNDALANSIGIAEDGTSLAVTAQAVREFASVFQKVRLPETTETT